MPATARENNIVGETEPVASVIVTAEALLRVRIDAVRDETVTCIELLDGSAYGPAPEDRFAMEYGHWKSSRMRGRRSPRRRGRGRKRRPRRCLRRSHSRPARRWSAWTSGPM